MATWIEKYEVVPVLDNTRGPHFEVVRINNRGVRKMVHRYKGESTANKVKEALTVEMERELP